MKKLIVLLAVVYFTLSAFMNSVKANDYGKAVVGHIIQTTVNGENVDHSK